MNSFGTEKSGGDIKQANYASQGNVSSQNISGAASTGGGLLGSYAGAALLAQAGRQLFEQNLQQGNAGISGDAGSDNAHADTSIQF